MDVKASDVKALREKTGAGMLDCKNALVETKGDFAAAEKKLKELGLAAAAKRIGKAANEGRIFSKITDSCASLVELSCETDFVARNQEFIDLGNRIVSKVAGSCMTEATGEVLSLVDDLKSKIKENMGLKRLVSLPVGENEIAMDYIHGEGSIGVIIKARVNNSDMLKNEKLREFIFDCALHIAAFSPLYLNDEDVDESYLKEQEEIFTKQAASLGKPANIVAGIVKGKVKKHLSEVVMLEQGFVKEEKKSVSQKLSEVCKSVGGSIKLVDYLYFKVGQDN
ncbi:MAG: translation elongation factor Ts [Spirochaetales bacterium]|nr:translation elongation factor Ts [Spirochaetales bacterium]